MDVAISLNIGVHLTVDTKSALKVINRLVGALCELSRQILHFLLQEVVVSFEDHSVLGQNLLRDGEAREATCLRLFLSCTFDFLLLAIMLWLIFVTRDGVQEDGLGVRNVARISIQDETLVHAGRSANSSLNQLVKRFTWELDLNR